MKHDDEQVGTILSRRDVLALLGAGGAALVAPGGSSQGASTTPFRLPACIVRPSQTAGPYFVDTRLRRSDVRSDPTDGALCEGAPLRLGFQVSRIGADGCRPLDGALVDIWQCDALGIYSGVKDINGFFDTTGKQFLRGHQLTDSDGMARFETIYPGWYQGRAVHIHFKVRTDPDAVSGQEFVSQLYFDDDLSDAVLTTHPYAANQGQRPRNRDDGIFRGGGSQLLLDVVDAGDHYSAMFDLGLQLG